MKLVFFNAFGFHAFGFHAVCFDAFGFMQFVLYSFDFTFIIFLLFFQINRGNTVSCLSLKLNDPAQNCILLFTFFSGSFILFQLIDIFKKLLLSLFVFNIHLLLLLPGRQQSRSSNILMQSKLPTTVRLCKVFQPPSWKQRSDNGAAVCVQISWQSSG